MFHIGGSTLVSAIDRLGPKEICFDEGKSTLMNPCKTFILVTMATLFRRPLVSTGVPRERSRLVSIEWVIWSTRLLRALFLMRGLCSIYIDTSISLLILTLSLFISLVPTSPCLISSWPFTPAFLALASARKLNCIENDFLILLRWNLLRCVQDKLTLDA